MFYCAEPFMKEDLKSKKGKETIQTMTVIIRLILTCDQLCIYAAMCAWSDQNNQNKEVRHREVAESFEAHLSHEVDPPQRLNCFGRPNARQQKSKTIAQV